MYTNLFLLILWNHFLRISSLKNGYSIKYLFLITIYYWTAPVSAQTPVEIDGKLNNNNNMTATPNCSAVGHIFEARGITKRPLEPLNDHVLQYCEIPKTGTCCTYNMESTLADVSQIQFEKNTRESIGKLSSVLGTRAQKFNDFFSDLLSESKKEFHAMFKRTYGVIYEENAYVFADLFSELEKYYARGKVDLAEAMDSFFNVLYQKMFTVLNAQYSFDDKYLGCVSEHMKELKPFGDVPDKLSVQIKRSFVATRTYAQALNTAADVAKNMVNIHTTSDCRAALTKMQQCGLCKSFTEKPCANYCVNVMKGCLQIYNLLDSEWDNFVSSMEKVSDRLLGPFNIVMVVEPINIKISEAIMNFQEAGQDISAQVFQGCGRPVLGRRKRTIHPRFIEPINTNIVLDESNTDTLDIDAKIPDEEVINDRFKRTAEPTKELQYEPVQFQNSEEQINDGGGTGGGGGGGQRGRRKNKKKQQQQSGGGKMNTDDDDDDDSNKEPLLDKLVKDIRQKVKESKKFWSNLPYQTCNNEDIAVLPGTDTNCWNGDRIDRYTQPIANNLKENPEFPSNSGNTRPNSLMERQLFFLKTAVAHLRNAYNGLDVEWSDQEEPYYGSGSGSGSGIDDDDDEDNGSGMGDFEDEHHQPHSPDNDDIPTVRLNNANTGGGVQMTNTTKMPGNHNNDGSSSGNNIHSDTDSSKGSGAAGSGRISDMSLRRALITYLFPIYMAWFGGILSDLL